MNTNEIVTVSLKYRFFRVRVWSRRESLYFTLTLWTPRRKTQKRTLAPHLCEAANDARQQFSIDTRVSGNISPCRRHTEQIEYTCNRTNSLDEDTLKLSKIPQIPLFSNHSIRLIKYPPCLPRHGNLSKRVSLYASRILLFFFGNHDIPKMATDEMDFPTEVLIILVICPKVVNCFTPLPVTTPDVIRPNRVIFGHNARSDPSSCNSSGQAHS